VPIKDIKRTSHSPALTHKRHSNHWQNEPPLTSILFNRITSNRGLREVGHCTNKHIATTGRLRGSTRAGVKYCQCTQASSARYSIHFWKYRRPISWPSEADETWIVGRGASGAAAHESQTRDVTGSLGPSILVKVGRGCEKSAVSEHEQ
jgi:hypothetical protein